jgi:hypothetical protein
LEASGSITKDLTFVSLEFWKEKRMRAGNSLKVPKGEKNEGRK